MFILAILSDSTNKLYICDGKASYLSTLGDLNPEISVAITGEELLEMLKKINMTIEDRYQKLKRSVQEERDVTFLDVYPKEGHVYFIFDEILALFSSIETNDKLKSPKERQLPKIQMYLTRVLQLVRAANVHVILTGQQIPATIIPTSSREAFGARMILGRLDPSNAIEILGVGKNSLPNIDASNYGSLVWLEGYGWDTKTNVASLFK